MSLSAAQMARFGLSLSLAAAKPSRYAPSSCALGKASIFWFTAAASPYPRSRQTGLPEKQPGGHSEYRRQHRPRVHQVAEKGRHRIAHVFGDATDEKIGTVADVGQGAHPYRSATERFEQLRLRRRQGRRAAGVGESGEGQI